MNTPLNNRNHNHIAVSSLSAQAREVWDEARLLVCRELEDCFKSAMSEHLEQAAKIGAADIVVGVPFYDEAETVGGVIETIREGLKKYFPSQKSVIVAVGAPEGGEALGVINVLPKSKNIKQIAFLLNDEHTNGKGWHTRAIMEIARVMGADLMMVEADLRCRGANGEVEGLATDWVRLLLEPIQMEWADIVISRFNRHYLETPVATHLMYPLLTAIYNRPILDMLGGQYGISNRLLRNYLQDDEKQWGTEVGGYGIDCWFITKAITSGARICEANLGIKLPQPSPGKTEMVLRRVASTLFEQLIADKEWWMKAADNGELFLLQPLAVFGAKKPHKPDEVLIVPQRLLAKYREGFNKFHTLYEAVFSGEIYSHLEELAETRADRFDFSAGLWVKVIYDFLLAFSFHKEFASGDLLNSFVPLFQGYVAGFALRMQTVKSGMKGCLPDEAEHFTSLEAGKYVEELVNEFTIQRLDFLAEWRAKEEKLETPVPNVTYREFIPGVPLVVPLNLKAADGNIVTANGIYESLFFKYKQEFEDFIYGRLKVPVGADSQEIQERIGDFMRHLERLVDKFLLPGNIYTVSGMKQVVEAVFRWFPHNETFALIPEMATQVLWRHPPVQLLTKFGYSSLRELLDNYSPNDVLALASWSEDQEYTEHIRSLLGENIRPEHFISCELKPFVVKYEDFPALVEMKESAHNKLTARIIVSSLHKGMGGEFPKLRYFTLIAKGIVEAERFGRVWQRFAEERKDFGFKVVNSLTGHWGREPLSAHNIFEDGHQRVLVERVREMAQQFAEEAGDDADKRTLAKYLKDMADSYHLALTLPDGTFIPCSAWTWASYSFKGGVGLPTPLSLHVERDWSSHDFLTEYFKATGGKEEAIEQKITELMERGREWEDMVPLLLGGVKRAGELVPGVASVAERPPAGALVRYSGNPILEPIKEHLWESSYVLNPGAISIDGRVYLVYRAVGEEKISRLGLAVSDDGFKFKERLEEPIFAPESPSEKMGCEDPRFSRFGDRIYMLYTAYDGLVAQIAMASISVDNFVNYKWNKWHRHGMVFPGFTDKDAALFPETFNKEYAMLHRAEPHMWLTFSTHLRCPWSRKEHIILAASQSGMVWDGLKIGAGAQPLKTQYGWLLITHGVDHRHVYRLGVMLLDLKNPRVLLYRSPNFILEPVEKYEVGEQGKSWVPNVVFTCGAVPRQNHKTILSAEDELLVYYGSSDSAIGVAIATIADLIPEKFR